MERKGLNEIRESFLRFFEEKKHKRLTSYPLLPEDDKSLLLINSGMAPMKNYFIGTVVPPNKRVATCQKCIRTPDIERVGKTSRHATFFEMLGNFSFGDYFKKEATQWAWEYVTQILKISTDKLWVSIYLEDDEVFDIWTNLVGVDPNKIVRMGKKDNFWEIGQGPCGPCSEIYFDRGEQHGCGSPNCKVGCDCDRYVEFWNLVFCQFDSDGKGNYTRLKNPNIDTGMGLERIACIMQDVDNIFEVDTIKKIMDSISNVSGVKYKKSEQTDISMRIITDHIRSTVFMIGDGIIPSNEGRGYVLRRLLRRAARHGKLLGINNAFLAELAEVVINQNINSYSELMENRDYIKKIINLEEERFLRTVNQGITILENTIKKAISQKDKIISGVDVFKLYDTFGFPIELTQEIAQESGLKIDKKAFNKLMEEQRQRARAGRASQTDLGWESEDIEALNIPATTFLGYQQYESNAKMLKVFSRQDEILILLDQTVFYPQGGGQEGDKGIIKYDSGILTVFNTTKNANRYIFHHCKLHEGRYPEVGDKAIAKLNIKTRKLTERNHTTAHILQSVLREMLGAHVKQAGSAVDDKRLRYDFTHPQALTLDEIKQVEYKVNDFIMRSINIELSEMKIEQAKKIGAMALFGEKYEDVVRVCNIINCSLELCGGTHVKNTSEIGLFKIVGESSVAAGVRRIEGVTSFEILNLIQEKDTIINEIAQNFKLKNREDIIPKVITIVNSLKEKEIYIKSLKSKIINSKIEDIKSKLEIVGKVNVIIDEVEDGTDDQLKDMVNKLKGTIHNSLIILFSRETIDKRMIVVGCDDEAIKNQVNSGQIIRKICSRFSGKGGGRPDLAMGSLNMKNLDRKVICDLLFL